MVFLMDTNAFSDFMGYPPRAYEKLATVSSGDRVCVCPIVIGEILFGLLRMPPGKKRDGLERNAKGLFTRIPYEPFSSDVAEHYARIKRDLELKGLPLADNDLWIAACAIDLSAVLVTHDQAFKHVNGLTIEEWTI